MSSRLQSTTVDRRPRFLATVSRARHALLALSLLALGSSSGATEGSEAAKSLCVKEETVEFSCAVPSGKTVSLCASPDLASGHGYLRYRFGSASAIELEYPAKPLAPARAFRYMQEYAAKGGTRALTFRIGAYRYSLFRTDSVYGFNGAGVIVDDKNSRVAYKACDSATVVEDANLFHRLAELGVPPAGEDVSYISADDCMTSSCTGKSLPPPVQH